MIFHDGLQLIEPESGEIKKVGVKYGLTDKARIDEMFLYTGPGCQIARVKAASTNYKYEVYSRKVPK